MNTTEKSVTKKDQNTTAGPGTEVITVNGAPFKRYVGGGQFRKMNLKNPDEKEEDVEDDQHTLKKDASGKLVMTKLETP